MPKKAKIKYLIFFALFNFATYFIIQSIITVNKYNLLTDFDLIIPFIPEFVWIYHTLLPVIFLTMLVLIYKKEVFLSAFAGYLVATFILCLFYVLFPSFYPREMFQDSLSISGAFVEITRFIDGANNTFPSGHVTFSWLLFFFMGLTDCAKKYFWIRPIYFVWALLISMSTLFLKQHFVLDVVSGVILASICYFLSKNLVFQRLLARKSI